MVACSVVALTVLALAVVQVTCAPLQSLAMATAPHASLSSPPALKAEPFPLSSVTLAPGSRLKEQMDANTHWLLSLDAVRLSCLYTSAANLTCSTDGTPYRSILLILNCTSPDQCISRPPPLTDTPATCLPTMPLLDQVQCNGKQTSLHSVSILRVFW